MMSLTLNEQKALILLFKDFSAYHNANTLSKKMDLTRYGTLKLLKRLEAEGFLVSQLIGKARIYTLDWKEHHTRKLLTFLLAYEAKQHARWQEEFRDIDADILLLFGSAVRNPKKASDIDILVIAPRTAHKGISAALTKIRKRLPKNLHALRMTSGELTANLKKKNGAEDDIIRTGIVLTGQDELYDVIKNVARSQ